MLYISPFTSIKMFDFYILYTIIARCKLKSILKEIFPYPLYNNPTRQIIILIKEKIPLPTTQPYRIANWNSY